MFAVSSVATNKTCLGYFVSLLFSAEEIVEISGSNFSSTGNHSVSWNLISVMPSPTYHPLPRSARF